MLRRLLTTFSIAGLTWFAGSWSQAQSVTISDRWEGDQNVINNVETLILEIFPPIVRTFIQEDYSEDNLVPYPQGPGGLAVVNLPGEPGCPTTEAVCYFAQVVTFDPQEVNARSYDFTFNVANTSPFPWSDYHFEFYDSTFTERKSLSVSRASSPQFSEIQIEEQAVWLAGGQVLPQGSGTLAFSITTPFSANSQLGLRQIATTSVPEPFTLLGSATALSVGAALKREYSRRLKKANSKA